MKINESVLDRMIRLLVGIFLTILYFGGAVSGFWGVVLLVVAIFLVTTGAIGYSLVYSLLNFHTNKSKRS
jgi:hypothetical protein